MQISGSLMRMNSVNKCLGSNSLILGRNFSAPKFAKLNRDSFEYTTSFKGEGVNSQSYASKRLSNLNEQVYCREYDLKEPELLEELKPEILEGIKNQTLYFMLTSNSMKEIVETLNGVSDETWAALKYIGFNADSIATGLVMPKPTEEGAALHRTKQYKEYSLSFKDEEQKASSCQDQYETEIAAWEAQFKRVKLLDKIFTPESIKGLKGNQEAINELEIWLKGGKGNYGIEYPEQRKIKGLWCALTPDAKNGDAVNYEHIMSIVNDIKL